MLVSIIAFLAVLSILVLVHEFGHFFIAKKNGVWVEEFGIGYPPRLWGKKVGETLYSINLLPLGGFVKLHGEQSDDEVTKPNRAFVNKSKKARFAILAAGVVMNFLLAVFCFAVFYGFSGIPRETNKVIVSGIIKNSPAEEVGLKVDDVIVSVNAVKLIGIQDFTDIVQENKGKKITMDVLSGSEVKTVTLTPRIDVPQDQGPIGVVITPTEIYFPPLWQRPFLGVAQGFSDALFWGKQVIVGLYTIVTELFRGQAPKDVAGPIGIYAMTSEVASFGILPLIDFLGIFSVNLAVVNFLPFPALDGGRFMFIVIEKIIGKKVLPKVENAIHFVGMAFLLTLMLIITVVEVKRLVMAGGSLQGFLESTLK